MGSSKEGKNRKKAGQRGDEGGGEERAKLLQNVGRGPKSTGQQTVREGKTRADKKTKYCSGLLMSESTEEETV